MGVPSLSQSMAWGPPGLGGMDVFEHKPDEPTACPFSLIPKANPTVSPGSGRSLRISPFGLQITASNRKTWNGVPPAKQVESRTPVSENPTTTPRLLRLNALALLPPGSVGSGVMTPSFQIAPRHWR